MSWAYPSALLEKRGHGLAESGQRTSIRMPSGLVEGAETIAFYALFVVLPDQLVLLFWAMTALVALAVVQRVRLARTVLGPSVIVQSGWLARYLEEP